MPTRPVSQVVSRRSFLKAPGATSAAEAARMMRDQHKSTVTVVNATGRVEGICSERDLVQKVMAAGRDPAVTPLAEIMTPNPQTIPADKPFCHALHIMFDGGFRHLPVVDEAGRPIGIVSVRDALGLEMIQFGQEMEQRDTLTEIL